MSRSLCMASLALVVMCVGRAFADPESDALAAQALAASASQHAWNLYGQCPYIDSHQLKEDALLMWWEWTDTAETDDIVVVMYMLDDGDNYLDLAMYYYVDGEDKMQAADSSLGMGDFWLDQAYNAENQQTEDEYFANATNFYVDAESEYGLVYPCFDDAIEWFDKAIAKFEGAIWYMESHPPPE